MSDAVTLVNRALIRLGKATITSLTDNVSTATYANLLYDEVRQMVLSEGAWNFAVKRTDVLAPLSDSPEFGFSYKFQLPTDCLYVLRINEASPGAVDYVVEGRTLHINSTTLYLRYISDHQNEAEWSPGFNTAFSKAMALELAQALRADKRLVEQIQEEYMVAVQKGLATDNQQDTPDQLQSSDLHDVR